MSYGVIITIDCDACGEAFEANQWDADNGLTLCDECTDLHVEAMERFRNGENYAGGFAENH